MPELPEVETAMRGLARAMAGGKIESVELRRMDLRWKLPNRMETRLAGARVGGFRRLGKYILADLSSGESLLCHLGMSGRFAIAAPNREGWRECGGDRHDHVLFEMENRTRIAYRDPRRFGMMDLVATEAAESHRLLAALGPDPLGNRFHDAYLHERLRAKRMAVKPALLDQQLVAGLGNIYVCEALWIARISPRRASDRISAARVADLVAAIRSVLARAIEAGGSTLRDHRQPGGDPGYFQFDFNVYGREDAPCLREGCGGTIRRIAQSGRSTFHCARCQK